jgi:hypothetical protein
VDDDMANLIVAQLLYLDAADPNRVCSATLFYLCMTAKHSNMWFRHRMFELFILVTLTTQICFYVRLFG